jgi:hypothetical protein
MPQRRPNLRQLAALQRWLIGLVIFAVAGEIVNIILRISGLVVSGELIEVIYLLFKIIMAILMIVAGWALGMTFPSIGLNALFMFVPGLNVLAILFMSSAINKTLRNAGVRVGLFGANQSDLELALDPALCRGCSYNLTGNVSGKCPECGLVLTEYDRMQKENK